jgi:predicted dithiol-disulfide oxidoreductase (DUF899 family)
MPMPEIVTPAAWEEARLALLEEEKRVMKEQDALAAKRRRMPMVESKEYVFEGPEGRVTLSDLFDGRPQLVVYRFFMDPGMNAYPERGCPGCSLGTDQIGHLSHLRARDVNYVMVSRGEQEHLQRYREHMGWDVPWYTLTDDWDRDFGVDEWHGHNVFIREGDDVFRTYFVDKRGDEALGSTWSYLDITPFGRQEKWEDSPEGYPQTQAYVWWKYHDAYEGGEPFTHALSEETASQRGPNSV